MQDLHTIRSMLTERGIDVMNDGLETAERQEIKRAYYDYQKALRQGDKGFAKRAHDACIAAIAAFDKATTKSNKLEELLG